MASEPAVRLTTVAAGGYEYDFEYIPPLAMIKSVPTLELPFGLVLPIAGVALRLLVNLVALQVVQDLKYLDDWIEKAIADWQEGNYLGFLEQLVLVVADIAKFYGQASDLVQEVNAVLADIRAEKFEQAFQDTQKLVGTLGGLIGGWQPAEPAKRNLDDYKGLFKTLSLPSIADTFEQDAVFADMRVAGPNPVAITRMTTPLAKFPVTNQQFRAAMGAGDSLDTAIADGRVYITDYAVLDWIVEGSWQDYQKYLWAPIAMFAVPSTGTNPRLKAVAIQVGQTPGPTNPVVTPPVQGAPHDAKAEDAWSKAKIAVQVADGNFHEAVSHLGQTHLVVEAFIMATGNQLSGHLIKALLWPHFFGTLFINDAAQSKLVTAGGTVDVLLGGTIDSSRVAAVKGAQAVLLDFRRSSLPDMLKARGVDDPAKLPYYPYRDIGLRVWNAIHTWTTAYVNVIYQSDAVLQQDAQLSAWVAELTSHQGGRIANLGDLINGREVIQTRALLAEVLAIVIFTASAQHSAVNFPQSSIMSFAPAMPLAGYAPVTTDGDWLALLPPLSQALTQLNLGILLGSIHYTQLGQYGSGYFSDANIQAALTSFQASLSQIETDMKNDGLADSYPYLLPSLIPQSINI